jgi:hypothetical protein
MAHFKNVSTGQVVEAVDGRFDGLARWVEVEAPEKPARKVKKAADVEPVDGDATANV